MENLPSLSTEISANTGGICRWIEDGQDWQLEAELPNHRMCSGASGTTEVHPLLTHGGRGTMPIIPMGTEIARGMAKTTCSPYFLNVCLEPTVLANREAISLAALC